MFWFTLLRDNDIIHIHFFFEKLICNWKFYNVSGFELIVFVLSDCLG